VAPPTVYVGQEPAAARKPPKRSEAPQEAAPRKRAKK